MQCRIVLSILFTALMDGCSTQGTHVQAVDSKAIGAVQAEIKRQTAVYMAKVNDPIMVRIADGKYMPLPLTKETFWCGTGLIGFDITSIKAELTVTDEFIDDKQLALSIPVHAVTLEPSFDKKSDVTNTQLLDYNLWLLPSDLQQNTFVDDGKPAPIAQVLLDLRKALILGATKLDYSTIPPTQRAAQPCFADFSLDKPASDAGNTYKIGLSIVSDGTTGVKIDAGIISLGLSSEAKSTTGNSLTVSFVQHGLNLIQGAKDVVDTDCKYPIADKGKCDAAKAALRNLLTGEGIGTLVKQKTS